MDAGTKADEHYQRHMAPWRFQARQKLLQFIRPESNVLAEMQRKYRRPWLDSYFALTANIGTHTFYMVMLPVIFWFVDYDIGYNYVLVLALGVFITGVVKDLLCLPRPASPPCHRISMSGSAKLEYGMPSTHSSNTIGVVLLVLERNPSSAVAKLITTWLLLSLVLGRLYTSMHGFIDVFVGIVLGFVSHFARLIVVNNFNVLNSWDNLALTVMAIAAISACPQPVDNCPCFDDSVAFIGVVLGAAWTRRLVFVPTRVVYNHYAVSEEATARLLSQIKRSANLLFNMSPFRPPKALSQKVLDTLVLNYIPHQHEIVLVTGWDALFRGLARFVIGVALIILWRHVSKRLALKTLLPIWKVFDALGLRNPRRHYQEIDEYAANPPTDLHLDAIPDSRAELKQLLHNLRHSRTIKDLVGPQSEADLFELEAQLESTDINQTQATKNRIRKYLQRAVPEKPEKRFSVEIAARLVVYAGIAPVALTVANTVFNILHI